MPGVEISQDALERFTGFSQKIRIFGSDNRHSHSRDEATTFLNSYHQITESVSEFSRKLHEFVGYINVLYEEKKITIENARLVVSQQVADEIDKKFDEIYEDIEIKRSVMSSHGTVRGARLASSNRGLLEEIQKASEQFERVSFSIWGIAHFTCSSCIQEKLTELKIPFAVLIPTKEKRRNGRNS